METAPQAPAGTPQIFISHARVDARLALQIERALTVWGAQPWVDQQQLAGGQEWRQELQQAIDRSAALLVVVTPAALASPMVRREYLYALSQGKPVLLVRFRPVAQLPAELAGMPSIDYRGNPITIGTAFFTLLEDHGLLLATHAQRSAALDPTDMFHLYAHRLPPEWPVFQLPLRVSQRKVVGLAAGIILMLLVAGFLPNIILATLGNAYIWVSFIIPLVVIIALFISRIFLDSWLHLFIVLGRLPRDTVILAPDHVTAQIYTFDHRRLAMAPYRYAFQQVVSATASKDRQGRAVVTLMYANGVEPAHIVLPRGMPQCHAIAARIVEQANAYRQARTSESADRAIPLLETTAPPARAPTYCVIAATRDQPLLREIQTWLARRGIAPDAMVAEPGATGMILPTQAGAARSRFALIVPSPAVMQTPQTQAIIADLRRQGKLVIPIRATAAATLPDQLAELQWIDFGPGIDHARSLLDLCDTLDQAGVLPALSGGQFDAELALARAIHERAPQGWYVAKPDSNVGRFYRIRQIASLVLLLYPLGLVALFAAAVVAPLRDVYATHDPISATIISGATMFVLVALGALPWLWSARLVRSFRFFGRLISGYHAPQCVVITPAGLAFHVVNVNGARFIDGGAAFAELQSVRSIGVSKLRLTPKQGAPVDVPLTYFGAFTDTLIARAQAGMRPHPQPLPTQAWRGE